MKKNEYLINKKQNDYKVGVSRQEDYIRLIKLNNVNCQRANRYEDKYEHWDLLTFIKIHEKLIVKRKDIKGIKRGLNEGYTWIELQTIDSRKGWLYGLANDIVFEMHDSFVSVKRKELKQLIEKNLIAKDIEYGTNEIYSDYDVNSDNLKYYQRYKRESWGDDDITIKVPFSDFEHLIYQKLYKKDGKLERITGNR